MVSESVAASPIHARDLAARIDALPASAGLWRFIILLSLGGFFELYDLFQTGYISTGLIADGIFHTGAQGVFGVSDQAAFASATFLGLFVGASLLSPYADRFGRRACKCIASTRSTSTRQARTRIHEQRTRCSRRQSRGHAHK